MSALLVDLSPLRENVVFRRLFIARTILLFGVGLVSVTVPLQVYQLTSSTAQVSLVSAVQGLAFFLGFCCGGVLSDRGNRWRLIRRGRYIAAACMLGMTANAVLLGEVWPVALCIAVNGVSAGIGITAMLSVQAGLVEPGRLHAVGALNTLSLRIGGIVAPVLGGALVTVAGAAWSYGMAAVAALLAIGFAARGRAEPANAAEQTGAAQQTPLFAALREGYRFIVTDRVVLGVMFGGVVGMLGGGSFVLVPAFVDSALGGEPVVVGLIYAALSAGLLLGAVTSGWIGHVQRPGLLLLTMMIVAFGCYAAAGAMRLAPLVVLFIVVAGVSISVEEVLRYALLQQRSPDALRGRVNSVFAAQNMSGAAVGALIAGAFGTWLGAEVAFWAYNAVMAAISVLVLAALPALRTVRRVSEEAPA